MNEDTNDAYLEYLITDGILDDLSAGDTYVPSADIVPLLEWTHAALFHYCDMVDAEYDPQMWVL